MSGEISDGYGDGGDIERLIPDHLKGTEGEALLRQYFSERQQEQEAAAKTAEEARQAQLDSLARREGRAVGLSERLERLEVLEAEAAQVEREREHKAFYDSAHFIESAGTPAGDMSPYAAAVSEIQPHHRGEDVVKIFQRWGV